MNKLQAKRVAAGIVAALISDYAGSLGHYDDVLEGNWTEADHDRVMAGLDEIEREMDWRANGQAARQKARERFLYGG